MSLKKIEVRVPGKLFVTGEYAVLFGAAAIITSVNRYANITISNSEPGSIFSSSAINLDKMGFKIQSGKFKIADSDFETKLAFIDAAITVFLKDFPEYESALNKVDVNIDTSQFYTGNGAKLGFGSSAAVTVGFLQALNIFCRGSEFDSPTLLNLAAEAHSIAQNKSGSGGDIAAAAYGKTIKFRKEENGKFEVTSFLFPKNFEMLTIWSGISCSTSEYISSVMEYKKNNPLEFENLLAGFNKSATLLADSFADNSFQNFSEEIIVYYSLLEKLGEKAGINIISKEHKKIHNIVRSCGGVYKPSGAGGGDIGLAFFDRGFNRDNLKRLIEENNFNICNLSYGV